jgi:hypothetical protein
MVEVLETQEQFSVQRGDEVDVLSANTESHGEFLRSPCNNMIS